MAFQVKTIGGAHDIPDKDDGRSPCQLYVCCMLIRSRMLYGILGNSLSFVLRIFSLCFRYFGFQMGELGMIAEHTPHVSAFCELL